MRQKLLVRSRRSAPFQSKDYQKWKTEKELPSLLLRRIIDEPLSAFLGLLDGALFGCKDDASIPGSPSATLILAVDPEKWSPHFIGRLI
jgi:hypothetical protein